MAWILRACLTMKPYQRFTLILMAIAAIGLAEEPSDSMPLRMIPVTIAESDHAPTTDSALFGPGVTPRPEAPKTVGYGRSLWRYLGSMGLMVILLGGAAYGLNRWRRNHFGANHGQSLTVTSRLTIDARHGAVLLRVHGEEVLVGLTADRMEVLGRYALLDEAMDDDVGGEHAHHLEPDDAAVAKALPQHSLRKVRDWP